MNIDMDLVIKIGVIALVCIVVLLIVISIIKAKLNTKKEPPASILDVDLDGVPGSDERTFDYGYEKEDTVVMAPVESKEEIKPTKKSTAKKTTTKKASTKKTTTKKTTTKKTETKKK